MGIGVHGQKVGVVGTIEVVCGGYTPDNIHTLINTPHFYTHSYTYFSWNTHTLTHTHSHTHTDRHTLTLTYPHTPHTHLNIVTILNTLKQ